MNKLDQRFNNANNYGFGNKENDTGTHDDVPQEVEEHKNSYTKTYGGSYSRHPDHHLHNTSLMCLFILIIAKMKKTGKAWTDAKGFKALGQ